MKKSRTKLQLKTNTIRMLQDADMDRVNGGASFGCTGGATGCSSHPPEHPPGSGHHGK